MISLSFLLLPLPPERRFPETAVKLCRTLPIFRFHLQIKLLLQALHGLLQALRRLLHARGVRPLRQHDGRAEPELQPLERLIVPRAVDGDDRTPACRASSAAPCLKGRSVSVGLSAPSGKMATHRPARRRRSASWKKLRSAPAARSTGMQRSERMARLRTPVNISHAATTEMRLRRHSRHSIGASIHQL